MSILSSNNEIDFEALWESAVKPESQKDIEPTSMTGRDIPESLLPASILQWFEDIADQCLKNGLIDEKQHGVLIRGGREQAGVFSSINSDKLKEVVASVRS